MEFDSVIKKRHSARAFLGKKVSYRDILDAIDAAIQGPFAGNVNNFEFVVLEEPENINAIADLSEQTWINEANAVIILTSDDTHLENIYGERGRIYSRQQAGAAIQTMLLKLVDNGLSACWVGSYDDDSIKLRFKIPRNRQIEAIIPIGYEDKKAIQNKASKKPLESSLRWEEWNNIRRPPLFKEQPEKHSLLE